MPESAEQAVARITGLTARSCRPLGGDAYQVRCDGGEVAVAKHHNDHAAARAEAASLEWLAGAKAVPVPRVRGHLGGWLVTDLVEPGNPTTGAASEFGRALAALHAAGAPAFGSPPPGGPEDAFIGLASMPNRECPTWAEFYGRYRIEPYLQEAVDRGLIGPTDARFLEEVKDRLPDLAGPPEPPARLHGDLWSGNVMWGADGRVWVIDPAAHGGHRETDLAMLALFGCPHLNHVLAAYDQARPLAAGWRQRVPLHQLFPLLVHTVLFAGAYAAQTVNAARRALGASRG